MKKTRLIVAFATVFFLLALGVTWKICTDIARRHTERVLVQSETLFSEAVDDWVYALLLHASENLHRELGDTAKVLPVPQMREMAARFGVDEVNVVGRDGICIGSTWDGAGGVGYDFSSFPATVPYLALTDGVTKVVSQPFRHGTTNPQDYSKYFGTPFKDGSGFLEVSFCFKRLSDSFDLHDRETVKYWKVGRTGHLDYFRYFQRYGLPADLEDGVVASGKDNGEAVFCRSFTFAGHRYLSILPEREYFQQRNVNFAILVPSLTAVLLFLTVCLRSVSRANMMERRRRVTEDESRRRDLMLAREVQLSGLEPVAMYRRGIFSMTFDAVSLPAREVGGDFYDFFMVNLTHVAFVIADVAGKGIPAAMYMMRARNEIFNSILSHVDLAEAMAEANRRLTENNESEMFVTVWAGVVDVTTGEVEYVNAGHDRPFVRKASGEVVPLMARGGRFMGVFPEAKYKVSVFTLESGDALFLYTDGITEAMNRERRAYGKERLKTAVGSSTAEAEKMLAAVEKDVREFANGAEQSDDITALALVWHGTGDRAEREFAVADAVNGVAVEWLKEQVRLEKKPAKARLLNAADEMMANIAAYSGAGKFSLVVENAPGRTRLTFTDDGKEYNPLTHADPDVSLPLEERPVGGLGILMTKKLVDFVLYRRDDNRNFLALVKFD